MRKDPAKPDVWRCCQTFLFSGKGADRVRLYWNQSTSQKALLKKDGQAEHSVQKIREASRDIVRLADMLGHSSIDTTRIYLTVSGAEQQRQLDRLGLVS